MLLENQEEYTIEHSMEISDLFESIAQSLQNDELDMDYDEIVAHLESNSDHRGYVDLTFRIIVDTEKKTITDIY